MRVAANPGAWGNRLHAAIDTAGIDAETAAPFAQYGLGLADLFNLTLTLQSPKGQTLASERYLMLAVTDRNGHPPCPRRIDHVLDSQSSLARVEHLSTVPPVVQSIGSDQAGNDGLPLSVATYIGDMDRKTGIYALNGADTVNLLCIPPDRRIQPGSTDSGQDLDPAVRHAATRYCIDRRAIFIVDPPGDWTAKAAAGQIAAIDPGSLGIAGPGDADMSVGRNAAVYFPRLVAEDPLDNGQPRIFAPCGAIAGVIASTDRASGVWKAPAGQSATIAGIDGTEFRLIDADNGLLNARAINCLREFPVIGPVVWGARTLQGADTLADDYKYLSVRRLALFIEESVMRGTGWAVFETNAEPLWTELRLQVESFMAGLERQGAFYGHSVICDASTNSQWDIEHGIVTIQIAFAPVKPAEFIIIGIQQVTQPPS
jgi:uncharacterized protein